MTFVSDVRRVANLGSKARHITVEVFCIVNLEDDVPQTPRALFVILVFKRTHAKAITKEESLVEGS